MSERMGYGCPRPIDFVASTPTCFTDAELKASKFIFFSKKAKDISAYFATPADFNNTIAFNDFLTDDTGTEEGCFVTPIVFSNARTGGENNVLTSPNNRAVTSGNVSIQQINVIFHNIENLTDFDLSGRSYARIFSDNVNKRRDLAFFVVTPANQVIYYKMNDDSTDVKGIPSQLVTLQEGTKPDDDTVMIHALNIYEENNGDFYQRRAFKCNWDVHNVA